MDTDMRVQTAIEAWAFRFLAVLLIFATFAVIVAVASRVHRQTDSQKAWTAVVCVRASVICVQLLLGEVAFSVEVDYYRGVHSSVFKFRSVLVLPIRFSRHFIRVVETVRNQVSMHFVRHTLSVAASEGAQAGRVFAERLVR
jgi:hypothetical protein